jgi:hypothetical protein
LTSAYMAMHFICTDILYLKNCNESMYFLKYFINFPTKEIYMDIWIGVSSLRKWVTIYLDAKLTDFWNEGFVYKGEKWVMQIKIKWIPKGVNYCLEFIPFSK